MQVMMERTFSQDAADERCAWVAGVCETIGDDPLPVVCAYSVKTNPDERMLATVRRHGFRAEVISDDEAACAERCGFVPAQMIYNGPRPPSARTSAFGIVFADSLEALARNRSESVAELYGVRLRPAMLATSRFGVPPADDDALVRELDGGDREIGISFHARRGDFGAATWRDVCGDVVRRAQRIARESGSRVVTLDVGGGWQPDEFDREFPADGRWLAREVRAALPAVRTIVIEPGQAIATPVESIVATVLEVRRRRDGIEAIVDLGYGDWPLQNTYPHALELLRGDERLPIGRGGDRVGGSTCLEYDYVDGLRFPSDIAAGDRILVHNAGSYDRSMSFSFGRGRVSDHVPEAVEA